MHNKKISILLALTLIFTGSLGTRYSYALGRADVISETLETTASQDNSLLIETDFLEEESRRDVVRETHRTIYSADGDAAATDSNTDLPEGVVKMVVKTTSVDENGNEARGTDALEITGESSMPDSSEMGLYARDIVNMVMPVVPDDTYDFVIDPQNLLSRYSLYKNSYEKASLYFTNSSGERGHTCISDVAMAKNKSSVPVLLYVTLQVEDKYGWPLNYTDMDSVETDGEKNISFALIPVSAKDTELETVVSENNENVIHKDHMISIDETGKAEMILYLPGTPDNFDLINDKYMAKEDAVWSSLGFAVTGACNTLADWSEIDERSNAGEALRIHISYRMDLLSEGQEEMIANGLNPDPETGIILFDHKENENDRDAESNEKAENIEVTEEKKLEITDSDTKKEWKEEPLDDEDYSEENIDGKEEFTDEL